MHAVLINSWIIPIITYHYQLVPLWPPGLCYYQWWHLWTQNLSSDMCAKVAKVKLSS